FYGCNAYFPRPDGTVYDAAYFSDKADMYHNQMAKLNTGRMVSGIDYATLRLTSPYEAEEGAPYPFPPDRPDAYEVIGRLCEEAPDIKIGDPVYLIGYPAIGGQSLTLTEGVISGFGGMQDESELIKVSASVNRGSSGGIAIGAENGCNYGVLTQASFAEGSNIGFLLSPVFIREFLLGITGEGVYRPGDAETEPFEKYTNRHFGVSIEYPRKWAVSEESDRETIFTAPFEGALDGYQEQIILDIVDGAIDDLEADAEQYVADLKDERPGLSVYGPKFGKTQEGLPYYFVAFITYDEYFFGVFYILGENQTYLLTTRIEQGKELESYAALLDTMGFSIRTDSL
ncbi:MAG: S1C family serine protease, partial [Patescibacteria group bacterium]